MIQKCFNPDFILCKYMLPLHMKYSFQWLFPELHFNLVFKKVQLGLPASPDFEAGVIYLSGSVPLYLYFCSQLVAPKECILLLLGRWGPWENSEMSLLLGNALEFAKCPVSLTDGTHCPMSLVWALVNQLYIPTFP